MPGMLCHLMFAEKIYRKLVSIVNLNKRDFLSGNLLPDLAIDKKQSHFQNHTTFQCLDIPNIYNAKDLLFDLEDSLKFGMFCHLYLDYYFIKNFLIPNFIWDIENMKIINPNTQQEWTIEEFFSNDGLYGAYTEINNLIIQNGHLSGELIALIPTNIPKTGIECFDLRKEKTWKSELNDYLYGKAPCAETMLDYEQLFNFINDVANQFVSTDFYLFSTNT